MKKVENLMLRKNKIEAEIEIIEKDIASKNEVILIEDILNLLDKVGHGYVQEDYYAGERYYSRVPGVKNIRIRGDKIEVKVRSNKGYLLPCNIRVRGKEYVLEFWQSKNFSEGIDYSEEEVEVKKYTLTDIAKGIISYEEILNRTKYGSKAYELGYHEIASVIAIIELQYPEVFKNESED